MTIADVGIGPPASPLPFSQDKVPWRPKVRSRQRQKPPRPRKARWSLPCIVLRQPSPRPATHCSISLIFCSPPQASLPCSRSPCPQMRSTASATHSPGRLLKHSAKRSPLAPLRAALELGQGDRLPLGLSAGKGMPAAEASMSMRRNFFRAGCSPDLRRRRRLPTLRSLALAPRASPSTPARTPTAPAARRTRQAQPQPSPQHCAALRCVKPLRLRSRARLTLTQRQAGCCPVPTISQMIRVDSMFFVA